MSDDYKDRTKNEKLGHFAERFALDSKVMSV